MYISCGEKGSCGTSWNRAGPKGHGSPRPEGSRLAELYGRHVGDGIRLAYLITGDRALGEDQVQDAFVRLAGRLHHLRDPDGLDPYQPAPDHTFIAWPTGRT
jgi:hypothetical protein